MHTGEISIRTVAVQKRIRCRESQHHCQWPTLYWGRDFSKTFLFPLTEAGIFVSTKFSKVLRTTFTISCQCYPLLIGLYASSHHYQRKSSSLCQKKIFSFQQRGNEKLLFHYISSWGQQNSGHCQSIYTYLLISDKTASESIASSPIWRYPVCHR